MSSPRFINLNLHSEYSIHDGFVRIEQLLQKCIEFGMPAVAITDENNFFGLIKFYKQAVQLGIKPIIGIDVLLDNESVKKQQPFILSLLAQNDAGYKNLINLVTKAYLDGQHTGKPFVKKEWIVSCSSDVIAISGGEQSDIGQALQKQDFEHAEKLLTEWKEIFSDRFYISLQRFGKENEEDYIERTVKLARKTGTPVVATNNVRFLAREDFEAHKAKVCIQESSLLNDPGNNLPYSELQYLRPQEEMIELFKDIPEAIINTVEIAKRCNAVISMRKNFLPIFPLPSGQTSIEAYFIEQTQKGFQERLNAAFKEEKQSHNKNHTKEDYSKRLKHEISVIIKMGYESYFLIVADFINWAKKNDIAVGPGRGSGAGSLVAYSLYITDVDPLEYDLLFERFLNTERISLPDFDIDFCMDGRDKVINYVIERYGRERVAQIVTHGTMAAKAVVRDVGRVLGYPYSFVDKIAKSIPFSLGITLKEALEQEETLKKSYKEDEEVKTLIDLAFKIEGTVRNIGKHAGGIVIAPTKLTDFTPLYCESSDITKSVITQFDKDDVETIGLVKFDFLGLRTLTIIDSTQKTINQRLAKQGKSLLDITKIPLDDKETYKLLSNFSTTAVFQLESMGIQELIKRLKPDCFNDIVALVALYRPGPLQSGMVDDFINRKHGKAKVSYIYPALEPILSATYGVIIYQEQVMKIAQVLAGYDLGHADILRSAMGKKKPEEMAKQRTSFLDGATKKGIDKHIANSIFDLMEKFAGYGFNKSHSVAYALLSYRTAWLKTHYPAEFMATVMSSDMDNLDKVVKLLYECKSMDIAIIPPDINTSHYKFTVDDDGRIVYGLGAIKGAGEAAIESYVETRQKNGNYKSLFDFCNRMPKNKMNRKGLEALIKSGAFDKIIKSRANAFASLDNALQYASQNTKAKLQKQLSLFDNNDLDGENKSISELENQNSDNIEEWSDELRLSYEKTVLGFYLTGHPIEKYIKELEKFTSVNIGSLTEIKKNRKVVVAGIITSKKSVLTKNNKHLIIITLEDLTSNIEVVIFSDLYSKILDIASLDKPVIIEGELELDSFSGNVKLRAKEILNLDQAREKYADYIVLKLTKDQIDSSKIDELMKILKQHQGGNCEIYADYKTSENQTKLSFGKDWQVKPEKHLIDELSHLLGEDNIEIYYKKGVQH